MGDAHGDDSVQEGLQEMNRFKSFEEVDSATEEHVQSKEEFFDAHGDDSVQEGLQRNNAAVNIQRFANGKQPRNQVKKLEKKNEEAKQQVAATANKWRGFSKGRQEKVKAAKKIQHFYRESKDVDDADLKNLADNTTKEIFNNLDLEDHEEDHGLDAEDHEDSENKKKAVEEMSRFKSFEEVHVHSATEKDVQSKEEFFDAHGDDSVQEVEEKSNYSTPQKTGSTQKKKNKSNSRKHVFRKSNYSPPQKTGSTQKKKNKSSVF